MIVEKFIKSLMILLFICGCSPKYIANYSSNVELDFSLFRSGLNNLKKVKIDSNQRTRNSLQQLIALEMSLIGDSFEGHGFDLPKGSFAPARRVAKIKRIKSIAPKKVRFLEVKKQVVELVKPAISEKLPNVVNYQTVPNNKLQGHEIDSSELIELYGYKVDHSTIAQAPSEGSWSEFLAQADLKLPTQAEIMDIRLAAAAKKNEAKKIARVLPAELNREQVELASLETAVEIEDDPIANDSNNKKDQQKDKLDMSIQDLQQDPMWAMLDSQKNSDRVNTQQSAQLPEVIAAVVPKAAEIPASSVNNPPISSVVQAAISRELQRNGGEQAKKSGNNQQKRYEKILQGMHDSYATPQTSTGTLAYNPVDTQSGNPNSSPLSILEKMNMNKDLSGHEYSRAILTGYNVEIGKSVGETRSFDFTPFYMMDDSVEVRGDNQIVVQAQLRQENATIAGVIGASGAVDLDLDLALSSVEGRLEIPLISQESWQKFIEKNDLSGARGFLLIARSEETESVDIREGHHERFFFDDDFKKVEHEPSYILYVVNPGMLSIDYMITNGDLVSKDVLIQNDRIYFEHNRYQYIKSNIFELFEKNLTSKSDSRREQSVDSIDQYFSVDPNNFSKNLHPIRQGNLYEFGTSVVPNGRRNYVRFSHLDKPIVVGHWGQEKIVLPGNSWRRYVFEELGIEELYKTCLVEVDLSSSPDKIEVLADSFDFDMPAIDISYRDSDGKFFNDYSEQTRSIYVLGNNQGRVNVKIEYMDGRRDIIQSYCVEDGYFIEQL